MCFLCFELKSNTMFLQTIPHHRISTTWLKKLYRLIAQWLHFTNVLQCRDRFFFFFQVFDPDNNHQFSFFFNISKSDNHWFWLGEKNQNLKEGDHSGYFKNLKELAIFMKELRVMKGCHLILGNHGSKPLRTPLYNHPGFVAYSCFWYLPNSSSLPKMQPNLKLCIYGL
jgi:hypothetical protein